MQSSHKINLDKILLKYLHEECKVFPMNLRGHVPNFIDNTHYSQIH